jgi:hypothetical protein
LNEPIYKEFKTKREVTAWANKHFSNILNLNPKCQKYKRIYEYTGSLYSLVNAKMRGVPPTEVELPLLLFDYEQDIVSIIKILKDITSSFVVPDNVIVYKYTKRADIEMCCGGRMSIGALFSDKAFMSTTLLKNHLVEFAKEHEKDCVLKIRIPSGTHAAYISLPNEYDCLDECELLLPANIKLKILDIKHNIFNPNHEKHVVECIVIND